MAWRRVANFIGDVRFDVWRLSSKLVLEEADAAGPFREVVGGWMRSVN